MSEIMSRSANQNATVLSLFKIDIHYEKSNRRSVTRILRYYQYTVPPMPIFSFPAIRVFYKRLLRSIFHKHDKYLMF